MLKNKSFPLGKDSPPMQRYELIFPLLDQIYRYITILHYSLAWRHFEVINSTTGQSLTSLIDCIGNQPWDFGSMQVWSHILVVQASPNPFFHSHSFSEPCNGGQQKPMFSVKIIGVLEWILSKNIGMVAISTSAFHNQRKKGLPNLCRSSTLKNKEK